MSSTVRGCSEYCTLFTTLSSSLQTGWTTFFFLALPPFDYRRSLQVGQSKAPHRLPSHYNRWTTISPSENVTFPASQQHPLLSGMTQVNRFEDSMQLKSHKNKPHTLWSFCAVFNFSFSIFKPILPFVLKHWNKWHLLMLEINSICGNGSPVRCCSNSRYCPDCWAPRTAQSSLSSRRTGGGWARKDTEKARGPPDRSCWSVKKEANRNSAANKLNFTNDIHHRTHIVLKWLHWD